MWNFWLKNSNVEKLKNIVFFFQSKENTTFKQNFLIFRIPARWQVPLAKSEEQFPVVVFSHGISGTRQLYSINCSSLSSHGYVVAALDHRYNLGTKSLSNSIPFINLHYTPFCSIPYKFLIFF